MAKFFEWQDAYSVGNDEIDDQHRNLVSMVNHLHEHMKEDASMRLYVQIFLDELVSYVDYHFATEERAMKESHYPDFEAHKKVHDSLRTQVEDFRSKFALNQANISDELMDFLKDWLLKHIGGMDTKIGAHLKAHGLNHQTHNELADVLHELDDEITKSKK
jgi:hemerythrin-like metal-binding protein